jgi:hypothetical protein
MAQRIEKYHDSLEKRIISNISVFQTDGLKPVTQKDAWF